MSFWNNLLILLMFRVLGPWLLTWTSSAILKLVLDKSNRFHKIKYRISIIKTKFSGWVENAKRPSLSLTFKTNYWYGYSWHTVIFLICFWPLSKRMLLIWILINCIGDVLKVLALTEKVTCVEVLANIRVWGANIASINR